MPDHFYPTGDRMNLAWRTEKVTGDRKKVIVGRFNLILRTVESDPRWEKKVTRDHLTLLLRTVKVIGCRFHVI